MLRIYTVHAALQHRVSQGPFSRRGEFARWADGRCFGCRRNTLTRLQWNLIVASENAWSGAKTTYREVNVPEWSKYQQAGEGT